MKAYTDPYVEYLRQEFIAVGYCDVGIPADEADAEAYFLRPRWWGVYSPLSRMQWAATPAAQQPVADGREGMADCQFCDNNATPGQWTCAACYAKGCRTFAFNLPRDNCLPATARAILELDRRPRQLPPCPRCGYAFCICGQDVDPRADGIARAVDRLSHYEPRLGASRWVP